LIVLRVIFVDQSKESDIRHSSLVTRHFVSELTVSALAALVLFFGIMPQTLAAKILACFP